MHLRALSLWVAQAVRTHLQDLRHARLVQLDLNAARQQRHQYRVPRITTVLVGRLFAVFAQLVILAHRKLPQLLAQLAIIALLVRGFALLALQGIHAQILAVLLRLALQALMLLPNQHHAHFALLDRLVRLQQLRPLHVLADHIVSEMQ